MANRVSRVSVVGLGCCNNFGGRLDLGQTRDVVDGTLDAEITLFDTADIYGDMGGSEESLGRILSGCRDQMVAGHQNSPAGDTGAGGGGTRGNGIWAGRGAVGGRASIRRAVEASPRRLRNDYLDLYQMHRPDPDTPISETLTALDELVKEGRPTLFEAAIGF